MNTTDSSNPSGSDASQAAEQLKTGLSSADSTVNQGVQGLATIHTARLSLATRTAAALNAQYGPNDPRVKAAEASVAATQTTIARVSMVRNQLAAPAVQVTKTGWALHGHVLNAQLQAAAKFTVFFVDASKSYLQQYGFAYTDATGYFLINYAADRSKASASPQLFIEVVNTDANPVFLSSTAFQPVPGQAIFQNIVLPAGNQPIGDPPQAIRKVAIPGTGTSPKGGTGTSSPKSSKS